MFVTASPRFIDIYWRQWHGQSERQKCQGLMFQFNVFHKLTVHLQGSLAPRSRDKDTMHATGTADEEDALAALNTSHERTERMWLAAKARSHGGCSGSG